MIYFLDGFGIFVFFVFCCSAGFVAIDLRVLCLFCVMFSLDAAVCALVC